MKKDWLFLVEGGVNNPEENWFVSIDFSEQNNLKKNFKKKNQ